jgi:hypothetical protein
MAQSAKEIVSSIADNETVFKESPKAFAGFVRKVTKTRIDFYWKSAAPGKPDEMTINKHGVVCSRTIHDGRTWYGYTLDPFGEDVSYGVACEVSRLMLSKFIRATGKAH